MFAEPEFWVAVAFVILMGVFVYFGIHRTVLTTLDHRSDRIKAELDDARRLKDEAAKLLAEYKARHASAEREAQDIIASAKAEAERIAAEAKAKMEDFVARRTKTAESKIALAEAQALADVRAAAHFFRGRGVRAIGVCLIHSYANPAHERRVAEILAQDYPDCTLSLSCVVLPEYREYERAVTTLVDAFVKPHMEHYLRRVHEELGEGLEDKPFLEPFSLIPALGAVTSRLRFVTFVLKLPVRPPVLVAKQAASVAALVIR